MGIKNAMPKKNIWNCNLWELIISRQNLLLAYKKVKSNKGVAGIDGMKVEGFIRYFNTNGKKLLEKLEQLTYQPQPTLRRNLPKPNSEKFRVISVPTVIDRVIQQAISQIISPILDKTFSNNSYAYRPGKNTHDALLQVRHLVNEGKCYSLKLDIENFFDTVPHHNLIKKLGTVVDNTEVCNFVKKILEAGSMDEGRFLNSNMGIPQGSPLSPLLSNIYLDSLDKFLESRNIDFVRYSDDCIVLAKSLNEVIQIKEIVRTYIKQDLQLNINEVKTVIAHINKIKFLGYGFYVNKNGCRFRLHQDTIKQLEQKIIDIFNDDYGGNIFELNLRMRSFMLGWLNYYKLADMKAHLVNIDKTLRDLARGKIFKRWVADNVLIEKLERLGIDNYVARVFAKRTKNFTDVRNAVVLKCALTNERLLWMGYDSFAEHYELLRLL